MPVRQPIGSIGFLLLALLFSICLKDVADAQTRWPPWQSYGEAENSNRKKARKPRPADAAALNSEIAKLKSAGKFAQAVPLAQQAVKLAEKKGPNSVELAAALDTLAELYVAQNKYAEAEPLLKRSLAIREKAPGQPDVAGARQRLAAVQEKQGKPADAEKRQIGQAPAKKNGAPAEAEAKAKAKEAEAEEAAKRAAAEAERKAAEEQHARAKADEETAKAAQAPAPKPEAPAQPQPEKSARSFARPMPVPEPGIGAPSPDASESASRSAGPDLDAKSGGGGAPPAANGEDHMAQPSAPAAPDGEDETVSRSAREEPLESAPPPPAAEAPPADDAFGTPPPLATAPPPPPPPLDAGRGAPPPAAAPPAAMARKVEPPAASRSPAPVTTSPPPAAAAPPAGGAPSAAEGAALDKTEWDVVPVLYGTDRAVQPNPKRLAFGSDRARKLQLGEAMVTVPKVHQIPNVERPWVVKIPYFDVTIYEEKEDPKLHFTVEKIEALTKEQLLERAKARLAKSDRFKDQAVVFVHGYNTSFDNALYRTAQIAYDLKFDGATFLYSWPSGGAVASYTYDRESAQASEPYLKEFLEMVIKQTGAKAVSVIAHSMGNQPLMDVLRDIKSAAPKDVLISQVILAAPDVDADGFTNLAKSIQGLAKNVTLYVASNDRALIVSRNFWGSYRAGDVPPNGPLVLPGVDTIDVTAASTDAFAINHSGYAQNNKLLDDIGQLIKEGLRPPEKRVLKPTKVQSANGDYWRYIAAPPATTSSTTPPPP